MNSPQYTPPTVVTSKGIIIGGAYVPPPHRMTPDSEAVQIALLDRARKEAQQRIRDKAKVDSSRLHDAIFTAFCIACGAFAFAIIFFGK